MLHRWLRKYPILLILPIVWTLVWFSLQFLTGYFWTYKMTSLYNLTSISKTNKKYRNVEKPLQTSAPSYYKSIMLLPGGDSSVLLKNWGRFEMHTVLRQ